MEHLSMGTADGPGGRTKTAKTRRAAKVALVALAVAAVGMVGGFVAYDGAGKEAGTARSTTPTAPMTTSPGRMTAPPVAAARPSMATATQSASAGLPTSPESYATAGFDAWLHGNEGRLRQVATGPVVDFLAARTPDDAGEWSGPACEGAAGSTYCAWTRSDAELVIRVGNEAVSQGRKHAAVEAFFTVPAGGAAVWPFTTAQQAAETQNGVDEGHQPWLLDPATVAVSYAGAELGWQDASTEQLQPSTYRVSDPASGARADVTLAQPARQGPGGIWAVVRAGSAPPT
jgi:hypothetical protein